MILLKPQLLLVGCGAMGSALLRGWGKDMFAQIDIVTPHKPKEKNLPDGLRYSWCQTDDEVTVKPDIVIFAVKPQVLMEILPLYKKFISQDTIVVSLAAGRSLDQIESLLGQKSAIIRCMPNLPVASCRGMLILMDNLSVSSTQREWVQRLFQVIGHVVWIDNESWFAPLTALSGSGPAYFYLLSEAIKKVAEQAGLPPELTSLMSRQLLIGAGAQLEASEKSAKELKQAVTSPQGVTAAALEVLETEDDGLQDLLRRAILKATRRAIELGK